MTAIRLRRGLADQAALFKSAQDAAEVAGVESKLLAEFGGGGLLAVRDFVEHAQFGEREWALEQPFAQHANLARVKAVEARTAWMVGLT